MTTAPSRKDLRRAVVSHRRLGRPPYHPFDLLEAGVTPAVTDVLVELAEWAVNRRTGLAQEYTRPDTWTLARRLAGEVIAQGQIVGPETVPGFLPWLALYASAPTIARERAVHVLACEGDVRAFSRGPWTILGPLGPLAYAAGLRPAEAWARRAMPTPHGEAPLTTETLQAMAALRGWPLPRVVTNGGARS